MLKTIIATAAFAIATSAGANAEMFTFASTNDEMTEVGAMGPDGTPFGGSFWTGKGKTTQADGSKSDYTYTCVSVSQPPRDSTFQTLGSCDVTASDGTFSVAMGCNWLDAERTGLGCVGGLMGKTGAYEGRRGAITNHASGGKSKGTGQWYEMAAAE